MRKTKKLTLSAIMTALGVVALSLGSALEILDFTVCLFASIIMLFIFIEIGAPFTYLVWIATSLLTYIFFPGSAVWLNYFLAFGLYPILKAYIERLPRVFWIFAKLVFVNIIIWIMIFTYEFLFGIPLFAIDKMWIKAALYLAINVGFVAYDVFLTLAVRLYVSKYRAKFARFLK